MPYQFVKGFESYGLDPSPEALSYAERLVLESFSTFTGVRLYFSPREVDVLTNRLDEPWLVHETTGLPFDVCENLCDSLNSTLKAARYIGLTLLEEERVILADCINSSNYADHWKDEPRAHRRAVRVVRMVALKLRGIGISAKDVVGISAKDVDSHTGAVL